MNIAIVYHYNPDVQNEWGTPQGIENNLKLQHKVDRYLLDPKNCNFSQLIDNSNYYDLIIIFYAGPSSSFDKELQILRKNTKCKIFLELGDEPQTFSHNQQRINFVDALFTPDLRCHNHYKSKGYNSYWMTHWCDNNIFYHEPKIEIENVCVTTCGDRPPYTNVLNNFFKDKFINKKINFYENTKFYNSGTVVFQYARWDEITRRIFEGGGCKKAILTNRISKETGIYNLFKEDEDICYYSSEIECVNKLAKLLNDHDYREKISNNMYNKIINNHLTSNRCELMIGVFND